MSEKITITANGKTQSLGDWARETGSAYNTLHARLFVYGWDPEEAVGRPADYYRYHRRRRMTATNRQRTVRRMREAGHTAEEIAEATGWALRTIQMDIRALGMSQKDRQRRRRKQVWALVGTMSLAEMARRVRAHRDTVHNDIKALMADPPAAPTPRADKLCGVPCDCGGQATVAVEVTIKESQAELHLCDDCHALFLEVEGGA